MTGEPDSARPAEATGTTRRGPGRPPRRRQAERTAATRQALLEATVDTLVDLGYGRTTTTAITRRAGVSVGALQHHFATKAELMVAAVGHVLHQRQAEFAAAMASLPANTDRLDAAIDVLWSMYAGPAFVAWVELWLAARTDPALAEAVLPMNADYLATCRRLFADVLADVPGEMGPAERDTALSFAFAVFDGNAMAHFLGPRPGITPAADIVQALKDLAHLLAPRPPEAT